MFSRLTVGATKWVNLLSTEPYIIITGFLTHIRYLISIYSSLRIYRYLSLPLPSRLHCLSLLTSHYLAGGCQPC